MRHESGRRGLPRVRGRGREWNRCGKTGITTAGQPKTPCQKGGKRKSANEGNTYDQDTDFWLKDASFLRMKYLTVSYTLPKNQFYNKVFDDIRFYVSGTNLFVLSKFNNKYYHPEIGNGNAYPVMRTISFGVNVKF